MTDPLGNVYRIQNFNDTFALGHYARVMDAIDQRTGQMVALKVLRPEHIADNDDQRWEIRAFTNEADLLLKMAESPYMVTFTDCGYLSGIGEAPVGGDVASYGTNVAAFASGYKHYVREGWRPYLALENLPRSKNLLYLMKPNAPGIRRRLPTEEGLALALQFAEMLRTAHSQRIVYLDHKLEHVYWDGIRLQVIDMNSSRQLEANASDLAQKFRTDIHNLCVGILYPVFTGLSPVQATLRPQPGGLSQVESRYQNVGRLDFGIEPTLSPELINMLQNGAAMEINTIDEFIYQLQEVASVHGWDFSNHYTAPPSRQARSQLRQGLELLREGEDKLRQARDLFREAAIQDDITPDLEDELRRLVQAANESLNHRVIP